MGFTRRSFIRTSALAAGGAAVAAGTPEAFAGGSRRAGFGPLVEDPNGMLDLPRGFRYTIVQNVEDKLSSGAPMPGDYDGMAAFPARGGRATLLVRNHELNRRDPQTKPPVPHVNPYDGGAAGGTTAVLVGADGRAELSWVSSSGTLNNCAGGATPWGTWITCEEDRSSGHGYAFEVDPRNPESDLSKTPIRGMGFFSHEAVDVDPRTGIFYLTEDDFRGEIPDDAIGEGPANRVSYLYRFIPKNRSPRPGALQEGGRLEVLTIDERPAFNVDVGKTRDRFRVVWRAVNPEDPSANATRLNAARFNRLEGAFFAGGAFWFDDTAGGDKRHGQLFRYLPGSNRLELFLEGSNEAQMDSPDNISIAPWGDLWFAEDGDATQRMMGVTPGGSVYPFVRNRLLGRGPEGDASELCGPCFSPDGRTFFVNTQNPGHTFAITGPFPRGDARAQRALATTRPQHAYAPRLSRALVETAAKQGLSDHEAAAFERLGVSLA